MGLLVDSCTSLKYNSSLLNVMQSNRRWKYLHDVTKLHHLKSAAWLTLGSKSMKTGLFLSRLWNIWAPGLLGNRACRCLQVGCEGPEPGASSCGGGRGSHPHRGLGAWVEAWGILTQGPLWGVIRPVDEPCQGEKEKNTSMVSQGELRHGAIREGGNCVHGLAFVGAGSKEHVCVRLEAGSAVRKLNSGGSV